jgi:hypothetical protein
MLRNKKNTKLAGSLVSHETVAVAVEDVGRLLRVALALESSMFTVELVEIIQISERERERMGR